MSDLFNPIGEKVEKVAPVLETNGINEAVPEAEDDGKVVEEIESLCMNCHENVSQTKPWAGTSEFTLTTASCRE